jgi:hypothetical protein
MPSSDNATTTTAAAQPTNLVTPGQAASGQNQSGAAQMPGLARVRQQVAGLRQTLHTLMADAQYADGEIVTASATLDAQLEDYDRTLSDKKQPGMRTF